MLFEEIDIDYFPELEIEKIKSLFEEPFKFIRKSDIIYIEIIDFDEGYIYIDKKGPENEWEDVTLQIVDLLRRCGIDAFPSDEDYGYIDVIVLNDMFI